MSPKTGTSRCVAADRSVPPVVKEIVAGSRPRCERASHRELVPGTRLRKPDRHDDRTAS
jgi:hypothetical protein